MFEALQDVYYIVSEPYILLIIAFLIDLSIGDPQWIPHPVKIMGKAIARIETYLRKDKTIQNSSKWLKGIHPLKLSGVILVITMISVTYGLFYIVNSIFLSSMFPLLISYLLLLVMIYLISATLATRGLIEAARSVIDAVIDRDIKGARIRVRHIVGRDTRSLGEKDILRATIESLAENSSDGIIAPIFYYAVGGLPLAMTYKAINTLDSMVGYKNDKYRYFGWAAARLDDIANYIPARITGILIVIASAIVHRSLSTVHRSLKTMLHDGKKHPSPNSGVPEAAMAGVFDIRLGGPATYGGIVVYKPYIGSTDSQSWLYYLHASENAILIVKLISVLGISMAVLIKYLEQL